VTFRGHACHANEWAFGKPGYGSEQSHGKQKGPARAESSASPWFTCQPPLAVADHSPERIDKGDYSRGTRTKSSAADSGMPDSARDLIASRLGCPGICVPAPGESGECRTNLPHGWLSGYLGSRCPEKPGISEVAAPIQSFQWSQPLSACVFPCRLSALRMLSRADGVCRQPRGPAGNHQRTAARPEGGSKWLKTI